MNPIITRFDKNSGDILLSIPIFDKDIFHRIQQIEKCNNQWFDTEHYNIYDLINENQSLKKENKILRENAEHNDKVVDKFNWENMLLKKENEEYCYLASSPIDRCRKDIYGEILDKMQELEGSDSNVKD